MDVEKALELIKRSPTEEILTEDRLAEALQSGQRLRHYIGFEISGFVHLGTGPLSMSKVADLQAAGIKTSVFLADYHTWVNKKLGGDMDTIKRIANNYFKESLKVSIKSAGGDPEKTEFILGSELYEKLGREYFENVLKVSSTMSLARARRSITVLGRKEGDDISLSQLIYVPMQAADIYSMKVNIAHAGMDQRKAHVVALESSGAFSYKPIALHQHLLMGMHITEQQRQDIIAARGAGDRDKAISTLIDIKMSKSKPQSAIFIHDSEEEIRKKIGEAYCPAAQLEINPLIDMVRYIIWPFLSKTGSAIEIENKKSGSVPSFEGIAQFEDAFASGKVHPADLKAAVAEYLIGMLAPARKYFSDGQGRKFLEEINEVKITR